jgi:hypothetical protein
MVDWTSGTNDANVAERDSGFVIVRIPGTPDVLKEAPVSGFVTKDASGEIPSLKIANTASGSGTIGLELVNKADAVGTGIALRFVTHSSGTLATGQITSSAAGPNNYPLDFFTYGASGLFAKWRIEAEGNFRPFFDNAFSVGTAGQRVSVVFAGAGIINTSDEREKTDISEIPEAWLDAWADVEWRRFKFVDRARWHIGLVAQQVHAAFAAHDIDAFEIGLCCYDEWEEEREPIFESVTKTRKTLTTQSVEAGVNENGQTLFIAQDVEIDEEYEESVDTGETKVTKPAGDRWGLRENECQAIEAAYKRRELSRMESRLALLEGAKS